jgi:asparagine synthetase B (glutamine-hydrolysing)
LIAAVRDPRGALFAAATVRKLFQSAGRPPPKCIERGECVIAGASSPLVECISGQPGLSAFSFGLSPGPPSLESISNTFALRSTGCLVAADEDGLLLARGPFGGRSLYYQSDPIGGTVVACSSLGALAASLDRVPSINVDRLGELIINGPPLDIAATPYSGVLRLESCQTIRLGRQVSASKHLPRWSPLRGDPPDDVARLFRTALFETAERAVRPFAKVAVMAGGGVDSAGLLAALVLSRRQGSGVDVDAFAMDFGGRGDDRPHLEALVRHLHIEPTRVRPAEAAVTLPGAFVADGWPNRLPGMALVVLMGLRARQEGAGALVMGLGGDEISDGDVSIFATRARSGEPLGALVDLFRLRAPWSSSRFARVRDLLLRRLIVDALPVSGRRAWRRFREKRAVRHSSEWSWGGPRLRELLEQPSVWHDKQDFWSALATDWVLLDCADIRNQHETAMGIPRLDPFLDAEFVAFMSAIPPAMFFYDHRVRGLYRRAMIDILPDSLRLRTDKACHEPVNDELVRAVRDEPWLERLLRMEALGDLKLVEPRRFRSVFMDYIEHRNGRAWLAVWPVLAVEAFVRDGGTESPLPAMSKAFS